jgi:hypothetical protein
VEGFAFCQSHCINKVLNKFNHLNIKEANIPYVVSFKLTKNNGRLIAQIEYASAISSLIYVMHCNRPDIASHYVNCLDPQVILVRITGKKLQKYLVT